MKIISVHSKRDTMREGDAQIAGLITDTGIAMSFLTFLRTGTMQVRFDGASLTHADVGRSAGGAAVGAVAGGLLLGPLGALAGAAFGGRKSHTMVLNSPDARVVFEATPKEFQTLLGLGLPTDTPVDPQVEHLPKLKMRWWVTPAVVLAGFLALLSLAIPRNAKPPVAAAATAAEAAPTAAMSASRSTPAAGAKTPAKPAASKAAATKKTTAPKKGSTTPTAAAPR